MRVGTLISSGLHLPFIPVSERRFVGLHGNACFIPNWNRRHASGYSSIYAKELGELGRTVNAHRLTYTLLFGIPVGRDMVLHRCGNAGCINPLHLYAGGDAENQRDKVLHELARFRDAAQELRYEVPMEHLTVSIPTPPVLSQEVSKTNATFKGFVEDTCYFTDWLASTSDGFPQLPGRVLHGDVAGAHRKAFQLFNGPLDRLEIVTQTCGQKGCLNPHHLTVSGHQSDALAFDVLHDRRCKIDSDGRSAISDLRRSAGEVARALGVHRQTVVAARADLRHSLRSGDSTR